MRPPRHYDQDFMAQRWRSTVQLTETLAFLSERHNYNGRHISIVFALTVGPWYNETLHNEDTGLTSDSLCPSYSTMYARRLRYNTHPSNNNKHIFPVPSHSVV